MPAPKGHILNAGPMLEYDPYRWLALNVFRTALTPDVKAKSKLSKWAIDRLLWLDGKNGRFWVSAAGQEWERTRERFIALCVRLGVAWAVQTRQASKDAPELPPVAGLSVELSREARDRKLVVMFARGATIETLAYNFRLSERSVYRILKGEQGHAAKSASEPTAGPNSGRAGSPQVLHRGVHPAD